MPHLNFNAFRTRQTFGEALGKVHGPMVPPVTAERDLQEVAVRLEEHLDGLAHERLHRIEEPVNLFSVPTEKVYHGSVESRIAAQ